MKLLLAHGASGTSASMRPWVDALAPLGVEAIAIDLPKGKAERALPAYRAALQEHPGAAIGGHSYGGRVASMLAAEESVSALVCLSYPLHPPGKPDQLRIAHLPRISCPALLLSGEKDPFAKIDLLRKYALLIPNASLVTYPKLAHGLAPVLPDASRRIAEFLASIHSNS